MHRQTAVGLLALALSAGVLAGRGAQEPSPGALAPDGFVRDLVTRAGIPGLQAAVAIDGRLAWEGAFGKADLEQEVPVTAATKFRVGSVSKSLTAAAVARVWELGRLDLDAPIARYVPGVPSKEMTVRQVASHVSGIRNYRGAEYLNRIACSSVSDALAVFITDPLLSPPGERFAYSSYNYTLLSAALEASTGQPFLEAMQRLVLDPLAMRATVPDRHTAVVSGRARWYERQGGQLTNAPWVDNSNKWAAGGYLSTAQDLVTFGIAMTSPGYLRQETREMLFARAHTTGGATVEYGIGWRTDPQGGPQVWHGGEAMGARAFLFLDPPSRSVVALVCNLGGAPFAEKESRALLESVRARHGR
jgi:CubicO group peptidase (beta-lactamase class C family)